MKRSGRTRIAELPTGNDGPKGLALVNLGRLMLVLGLVNPPFWASIIRGITTDVIVAGVVFSGLMIVCGGTLTLIGRYRIVRDTRSASRQESRSWDRRQ